MLENLRPTEAEYRDGIIRARRMLSALDPNHTAWEDRTLNDWLQFVQEFSQMVHYVNERNERQGTWEGLLSPQRDWATAFASDTERQEALAEFRALLVAYTQQQLPETTTADTLEQLSRPHRVLLLIFLKLLDQFKDPFNHLVGRHLQYQMEEILRFRPRPSQADTLGVEVRLEDDAAATMLPKGSLLDAGEDADGNPLQYATEYDTWLHTTQVTGVRSLFMKKTLETLELVHNEELDKSGKDEAFTKLLEFAIGEKGIGTPLAPLPEGIADLYALRDTLAGKLEMKRGDKFADVHWVYLYQHLYMDYATFSELLDIQTRSKDVLSDVHGDEWPLAYGYLELAYLRKQVEDRKLHLTQLYEAQPGQAGYMEMLRYAFGEVQPPADEVELAEYKGVATDPGVLYADLKGGNASDRNLAEKYLSDEWSMEGPDFSRMHEVVMDTKRTPAAWDEAMSLLESAMRKKQRLVATVPQREVVGKLYAFDNPEEQLGTKNTDASHQAWPLFGQENNDYMPTLGFRIRSPLMALSGGQRVLNLYLSLERSTLTEPTLELLEQLGKEETLPIESAVWVNEEMVPPNKLEYTFANQVLGKEIDRWSMQEKDGLLIIGDTDGAVIQSQLGRVVVLDASGVLRIPQEVDKANSIRYEELGVLLQEEFPALDPPLSAGTMAVFPPEQVFANAICLQYHYGLEEPSLFPEDTQAIPELFLTFDPHFTPTNFSWPWSGMLPALRYVKVAQMHLEVTVQDLPLEQGQNDTNTLDPAKPFTPFGDPCNPGNSFYFMHPEMASKPLDQLQLEMDWMQLPDSFTDYYATYPQLKGNPLVGQGEGTTATVRLRFRDGALPLVVDENITLFPGKSDNGYHRLSVPVKDKLAQRYPEYAYPYRSVAATRNLLEASRFFTLEYTGPSFGQSHYEVANLLFFQQLTANAEAAGELVKPPEPYVPKVKELKLSYTSSATRASGVSTASAYLLEGNYITPFGARPFSDTEANYLIPKYDLEGECYLGLSPVQPGQVLSLWFQMAEGSSTPDLSVPTVIWSYPGATGWTPFPARNLLRDTTQGLTRSGMVYLQLPKVLGTSPELPSDSYWLRLGVARDAAGLPLAISVCTNGVSAVLAPGPRAASHYERPLPAESISQLEEGPISVREVVQPFSSSHGLPQELPEAMYIRAGERIRHKNRALTQWDYERLVINQFANVYKVRCLSSDHIAVEEPGLVKVVVIPDLRGKTPFDPLQPKLPSSQLASIQNYLEQYCPPSANLQVVNPRYVQVRVRFAVRIRPGYSEELSQEELQTAVKRFLSPWAFEEGHEITFGGEIYANALVGYVETLPYVDYVARVRLFSSESGDKFLAVRDTDGMYRVSASEADQILVSADSHDIDLIGDAGYELSSFAGIEHDKIELDFQVGDD